MARRRRARPTGARKSWGELTQATRQRVANQLREGALETLSTLQDIGPAYSGEFSESWVVETNAASRPGPGGVPILLPSPQGRDLRRLGYTILNTSDHADEAMDLVAGEWITPEYAPLKPLIQQGKRVGRGRTDVIGGDGEAGYTAPPDWWRTYAQGGQFTDDVQRGFRVGTRQARSLAQGS